MKKSTKKRLVGAAWTVAAFVVGKFVWSLVDGDKQADKVKSQLS